MALYSEAQHMTAPFEVMDDLPSVISLGPGGLMPEGQGMPQVILYSEKPSPEQVLEMHEENQEAPVEASPHHKEEEPGTIEITVDDLPGVDFLDPELEKTLEVHDDTVSSNETLRADVDQAKDEKKSKKDAKWDWEARGPHGFVAWIKERLGSIPMHSGYDTSGLSRAAAFLEKLDDEISKAMRSDLDGALDANAIEKVRSEIDDGIERLHARIEKVRAAKGKGKRRKKSEEEFGMVKEAQKAPSIHGIIVTVPLIVSTVARTCINGT